MTFEEFVHARLPHLLRLGTALAGDEHRGADVVQAALERALPRWSKIREPEAFVRRVMVNETTSAWRRVRRERPLLEQVDSPRHEQWPDHDLLAAVRRLPPRQRAVIALRYFDDLTEAQTAELLGCSVGTVKSQAHHGLKALRTQLPAFTETEDK